MDLHNLVTVEYNVTYNQTKLEQVLKDLQSKLSNFNNSIKTIDQQCQKIKQTENKTLQKVQKLQQFTIDNLRQTVNEVSAMKSGLINYLGDQWVKNQQNIPIPSITQFSSQFQSRLSAFNSQTRKLNRKVSIIEQELAANSSLQKQQNETVKNSINQQKKQISKVRQSIRDEINQKFIEFQKQFQDKNLKEIIQKVQHQCQQSVKQIQEQGEAKKNQLMKALKQMKNSSVGKKLQNLNPAEEHKGRKFKFDKKNLKKGHLKSSQDSQIQGENEQQNSNNYQNDEANQDSENNNKRLPTIVQSVIEQQSMQHAINSLKDELKLMLDSEMLQFRSGLQSLNARYQKVDSSITFLTNVGKQHKNSLTQIEAKIADLKNQIENNKTALYETNQKHNQSLARIIEQEQKTMHLQADIMNLINQFKAFVVESQQTQSYLKFKDIQNMGGSINNNRYRNSLPNCITTPILKDDNIFAQRLNNLTEKVSKIQDKLKNGHQGSQPTLPRINSSSHLNTKGSNVPSIDLLRKDLQRSNEQINKTNERLQTLKKNLRELQAAHSVIPAKIQKLQIDVRNVNQIQQERLLELIKELINRVLTDPFNNNFTNTLKRQIHVKFLEIKHEYSSIWKDIEAKVTDRAENTELIKLKQNVENQTLQIKSLVNKKADNDDFKKGIKYLDSKLKQLYSYLKLKQTQENSPQGRKYYMGKKA